MYRKSVEKKLSELSIADLMALHTNFWASRNTGARFQLVTDAMFERIEKELKYKVDRLFKDANL